MCHIFYIENTEGAINYVQSRETDNIGYTRDKTKTNKTKTIQRNWQHRVHNKTKTNKTKHNTICVGHHYTQTNTTQYVLDTTIHKQTQHNMCWTPLYTNKHNTICVGHHYTQTNTNNVNKTWALLQTTGGQDEPNIVFKLVLTIAKTNTLGLNYRLFIETIHLKNQQTTNSVTFPSACHQMWKLT